MTKIFYSTVLILLSLVGVAQEGLRPLRSNPSYIYKDLKPVSVKPNEDISHNRLAAATATTSIELPFIDDFSYSPFSLYPDQRKWSDSSVYVNSGFAIAPPSIGVATFDGLNKHGYPYNPTLTNLTLSSPADELTSQPINLHTKKTATLSPASEVLLTFHYQARGNGDMPELTDSLVLDFYKPRQNKWANKVWFARGNTNSNTNDTAFKFAFVRITDTAYFHDGFKFRFRNWASVTGDFDHWHLDYLFLDSGRNDTLSDTLTNDITIATIPTPFLKDYSEMPFQQYKESEMATNINVRIRNNSASRVNLEYHHKITNETYTKTFRDYPGQGNADNLNPFHTNTLTSPSGYGYSQVSAHARPPMITNVNGVIDTFRFKLPAIPERFIYMIKHYVYLGNNSGFTGDILKANDTVMQYHNFRDFYSFDDGSAEAGYYVNATGARVAVKIRTNVLDTLKALRIYFDPVGNINLISSPSSIYTFTLNIWALGPNGGPAATPFYSDSVTCIPSYSNTGFRAVPEYKFRKPLILGPGTYFIGVQQSSGILTFGFDRNYDHHTNLYYDAGSGWTQSAEIGSIMMRPVFANILPDIVGIKEYAHSGDKKFTVYPNPSSEQVTVLLKDEVKDASYQVYSALGQLVSEGRMETNSQSFSVATLDQGIYLLVLKNKGQVQQQKLIVQH